MINRLINPGKSRWFCCLCIKYAANPQLTSSTSQVRHDFAGDFDHKQRWIFLQCCEVPWKQTSWRCRCIVASVRMDQVVEALSFYRWIQDALNTCWIGYLIKFNVIDSYHVCNYTIWIGFFHLHNFDDLNSGCLYPLCYFRFRKRCVDNASGNIFNPMGRDVPCTSVKRQSCCVVENTCRALPPGIFVAVSALFFVVLKKS